ncbi:rho guanine nucleotide exchange factor 16 isoform X2 [Hydra vulgaris]|uniref:rho guanine nucleotide exchange factor 16 isoform X2 n=1 Tax=Hydra vulgaris TaxID=6087 RepID=UPI001F5EAD18|nr:rho guanine nucleotide exchange factor 16 isoform X2 [Hydra vulgaris]
MADSGETLGVSNLIKQFSPAGIGSNIEKPSPKPRNFRNKTDVVQRPSNLDLPEKPTITQKPAPSPRPGLSPYNLTSKRSFSSSELDDINKTENNLNSTINKANKPIPPPKKVTNLLETKAKNANNIQFIENQHNLKEDIHVLPSPSQTHDLEKINGKNIQYENTELKENKVIRNKESSNNDSKINTLDGLAIVNNNHKKLNIYHNNVAFKSTEKNPHPIKENLASKLENSDENCSGYNSDYEFPYDDSIVPGKIKVSGNNNSCEDSNNNFSSKQFKKINIDTNDDSSSDDYDKPEDIEILKPVSYNNKKQSTANKNIHDDYENPNEKLFVPTIQVDHQRDESSDDYDDPDDVELLGVKAQLVPTSTNNLISSSDDDDNYEDPETNVSTIPPLAHNSDSLGRGNVLSPEKYVPLHLNNDFLDCTTYIDPAKVFSSSPNFSNKHYDDIYDDEPLYQVYTAKKLEDVHRKSKKSNSDDSSDEYKNLFKNSKSPIRLLWAEIPEVLKSGILNTIEPNERKRQEAMFEVITSEASYLKSLDILISHFMMSKVFLPNPNLPSSNPNEVQFIDRQQYHFLFSGLSSVKSASERFLRALRKRQQENVLINSISDIILEFANSEFNCYIKYCSNQVFQDRTFQALVNTNPQFADALRELEADPKCQGLSMHSFLTMPMQRITRLPLLVDAIIRRCELQSEEYLSTEKALKAIHIVVHNSNEGARKMERTEEMYYIQKTLVFKTKPIPLVSASRWLVKKGFLYCLHEEGRLSKYKNQLRQIFKGKCKSIFLFLFTDIVIITKMKSEGQFKVIDYCQRSLLKVEEQKNIQTPDPPKVNTLQINPLKYAFTLILLENCNNKTVEYHCFLNTLNDKTRWDEVFFPNQNNVVEGESIYDDFDCPQVQVKRAYQAQQSDELTLIEGDVLKVLRKTPDGWCEGMRLRDDEKGWFPIDNTYEIDSKHKRAKNLMLRYRLLTYAQQNITKGIY